MAFFAKVTCIDIFEQEPRRAVEGISSPSPQPEDPERALDPGLEEDPDMTVELVNGIFYRASRDGASVAITADYPGLLPTSRVNRSSEEDSFLMSCLIPEASCFGRDDGRSTGPSPWGLVNLGRPDQEGSRGRQ